MPECTEPTANMGWQRETNIWMLSPDLGEENPGGFFSVSKLYVSVCRCFRKSFFSFCLPSVGLSMGSILYILPLFFNSNNGDNDFLLLHISQEGWHCHPTPRGEKCGRNIACPSPGLTTFPAEAGMSSNLGPRKETLWVCFSPLNSFKGGWDFCAPLWVVKHGQPQARLSSHMKSPSRIMSSWRYFNLCTISSSFSFSFQFQMV